jgi:hypothetical protein
MAPGNFASGFTRLVQMWREHQGCYLCVRRANTTLIDDHPREKVNYLVNERK